PKGTEAKEASNLLAFLKFQLILPKDTSYDNDNFDKILVLRGILYQFFALKDWLCWFEWKSKCKS
ncbi:MAG: hypothetical protein ACO2Y5_08540, partial [Nitrosopumilaceae archaeon]